ncbi:MAG: type 1 glutamine amidotransferase [Acidobacteriota bacterium]
MTSALTDAPAPTRTVRAPRDARVLLIQVRGQEKALVHERYCVLEHVHIAAESLVTHNVIFEPDIRWDDVRDADVVLIGGSGDHSATDDEAFTEPLAAVTQRLYDEGVPTFGICWGHHFMARALGGTVITDPESEEVGCFEVYMRPAAALDPLMSSFSNRFPANLVHHDRVAQLPSMAVDLAYSEACPYQILRYGDGMAYSTQFHGEMDADELRTRLSMYRESYVSDDQLQAVLDSLRETPEAQQVLQRFFDLLG